MDGYVLSSTATGIRSWIAPPTGGGGGGGGPITSQVITETLPLGSQVVLGNGVVRNLLTLTLAAGDWDIRGSVGFIFVGGAVPNTVYQGSAAISQTSLRITDDGLQGYCSRLARSAAVGWTETVALPSRKINLPTNAPVYLVWES